MRAPSARRGKCATGSSRCAPTASSRRRTRQRGRRTPARRGRAPGPAGPAEPTDRHRWHRWDGYLAVHTGRLEGLTPHFLLEDELSAAVTRTRVRWSGTLYLVDGLALEVKKEQAVRQGPAGPEVRTLRYAYQLLCPTARRDDGRQGVFRYDNFHAHPGHADAHHCHRYHPDGTQIEPPEHVGAARWPTLGDVLDECHRWWTDAFPSRD